MGSSSVQVFTLDAKKDADWALHSTQDADILRSVARWSAGENRMKLTNKAREELRGVLRHMERGRTYVMADHIAVCRRASPGMNGKPTTTLGYQRPSDGACLSEVNREVGSDLCALETAIDHLAAFIVRH